MLYALQIRRVRLKYENREEKMGDGSPRCNRNIRGLATDSGNFAKSHLFENRIVKEFSAARVIRKKGD
jgi:hypothetical protein